MLAREWRALLSTEGGAKRWQRVALDATERLNVFTEVDAMRDFNIRSDRNNPNHPLSGQPFAVKDNIAVRGFSLSCGSNMLRNLTAPYTATAVSRLQDVGAQVVGKTNLDEFGMGSSSETSCFGAVCNPWNTDLVAGGSSGGSAAAVACGIVPFALGSDTGGSIRQPASFCGVYGLKPTYGSVSRFGLVAYASSLDVIGITAVDVKTMRSVFKTIRGVDTLDQTSVNYPLQPTSNNRHPVRVGFPARALEGVEPAISKAMDIARTRLEEQGINVIPVEIGSLEEVVPAYYIIATAEASANLARYDGVRYGERADIEPLDAEELTIAARSSGFGAEVKLRVLVGTYVLRSGFQEQYYQRAQRVRTLIRGMFRDLFQDIDSLLLPTFPIPPFRRGKGGVDAFQQKQGDVFTCTANLTGLPALAVPVEINAGRPIGVQLMAPYFREDLLLDIAGKLESRYPIPQAPFCFDLTSFTEK